MQDSSPLREGNISSEKLLDEAFGLKVDRSSSLSIDPRESVSLDKLKNTDSLETNERLNIRRSDMEEIRNNTGVGVINYSEHYHSTR